LRRRTGENSPQKVWLDRKEEGKPPVALGRGSGPIPGKFEKSMTKLAFRGGGF